MTEEQILTRAKNYLEKLAAGIDPLTGNEVGEGDIVRNERISRCFSYVAGFIDDVVGNKKASKRSERTPFTIDANRLSGFEYSNEPLRINEIAGRISALAGEENSRRLSGTIITNWLLAHGFLEEDEYSGKKYRRVTDEGRGIGIFQEEANGRDGIYMATFYTIDAQRFIIDNLEAILAR